jgi:hypothetical protein
MLHRELKRKHVTLLILWDEYIEAHPDGYRYSRRRAPFRRLEISFSQGAEWKALINRFIGTIPLSGDASCPAEQSMSGGPPPRTLVSGAMIAKVGAAARHSQSVAPRAAALPLS